MQGKLVLGECDVPEPPVSVTPDPIGVNSVSVSQVNEFDRCARRWFFRKPRKVEVPQEARKKSADTGVEIHGLIEGFFKHGSIPQGHPHERKIKAAVAHLPAKPGDSGIMVERRFRIEEHGLPAFTGIIDWVHVLNDSVRIVDHKTTSKLEERRLEPVDVLNDPQMLTYAEWGFREYDRPVEVAHNTISTTHVDRVLPLKFKNVPRDRAATNWERQCGLVRKMVQLADHPPIDWNDVPCNPAACHDYGGCDFLPICALKTPTIGALNAMSFDQNQASALLAQLKGLVPKPPVPVAPPVEEPVALLPPDAPTRMTPQPAPEPEVAETAPKAKRAPKRQKYEYMTDKIVNSIDEAFLNERGEEGWDLVGFYDGIIAVFKRAI